MSWCVAACVSCCCSLKDELYKRRMQRELMRAKGLLGEAEKPPEEEGAPGGWAGRTPARG
jgi:hypothetical protein